LGERIELAEKTVSVLPGGGWRMGDEALDRFTAGVLEGRSAAELSGISLHGIGIEVVLADEEAETIAETRLAIVRAIQLILRLLLFEPRLSP
jgi:hypothetical protein